MVFKKENYISVSKETLNDESTVLNCELRFKYYYFNDLNNEYLIKVDILFKDGRKFSNFLKSSDFIEPKIFKRNLAKIAPGSIWSGSDENLNYINNTIIPQLRQVNLVDTVGYLNEHQCYVYPNFGVKDGKIYKADEDGIINFPKNLSIKNNQANIDFKIDESVLDKISALPSNLITDIFGAYGEKGIVALTYWFGSLFSEQIREKYQTFPFLEISGASSTGKTTLIEVFWKLFGQTNKEGITAKEASDKGLWRSLAQISNMPTVFIESDSDDIYSNKGKFNFDKYKSLYSGRGLRLQGVKDNSNTTLEYPFKSSLAVVQNREIKGKPEITDRFISLYFNIEDINSETAVYAQKLVSLDQNVLSNFLISSLENESLVLQNFENKYSEIKAGLQNTTGIFKERLLKNYTQMLILLDSLASIFDIDKNIIKKTKEYIIKSFISKDKTSKEDSEAVKDFFEVYEFIENIFNKKSQSLLNHSRDSRYIAININHYAQVAKKASQYVPHLNLLREELKLSKKYKFVGCKYINSAIIKAGKEDKKGKTIYCWIFELPKEDLINKETQKVVKNSQESIKEIIKEVVKPSCDIEIEEYLDVIESITLEVETANGVINKAIYENKELETTADIGLDETEKTEKIEKTQDFKLPSGLPIEKEKIGKENSKKKFVEFGAKPVSTVLDKTMNLIQTNYKKRGNKK